MKQIIEKAKKLNCKCIIADLTKPDYDYYSSYEDRMRFFKNLDLRLMKKRGRENLI